jgi:hypothetical protein
MEMRVTPLHVLREFAKKWSTPTMQIVIHTSVIDAPTEFNHDVFVVMHGWEPVRIFRIVHLVDLWPVTVYFDRSNRIGNAEEMMTFIDSAVINKGELCSLYNALRAMSESDDTEREVF